MKHIIKFDSNLKYQDYLNKNGQEHKDLSSKIFYIEDEETLIIGSGENDIYLDISELNKENSGIKQARVYNNSDSSKVQIVIFESKVDIGDKNIHLCSVLAQTGYAVDLSMSSILMKRTGSETATPLIQNEDWEWNSASGEVILHHSVEGDIYITFWANPYEDLQENKLRIRIKPLSTGVWDVLYDEENGINNLYTLLDAGSRYELEGTVSSNMPVSFAINSGTQYGEIEDNNILYLKGYNGTGGAFLLNISSNMGNGYMPVSLQIQITSQMAQANIEEWNIPEYVYAGDVIDFNNMITTTGNCPFNITLQNNYLIETGEINVYQAKLYGIDNQVARFIININGNEMYLSNTIEKTINIKLIENTLEIINPEENAEFDASTPVLFNINVSNENNNTLIYTSEPSNLGSFNGNEYITQANNGNVTNIKLIGTVENSGNYAGGRVERNIKVNPLEVNIYQYNDERTEVFANENINVRLKSCENGQTTFANPSLTSGSNFFTINNTGYLSLQSTKNLGGENRTVQLTTNLAPRGNYKATSIIREITFKLIPTRMEFMGDYKSGRILVNATTNIKMDIRDTINYTDLTDIFNNSLSSNINNYIKIYGSNEDLGEIEEIPSELELYSNWSFSKVEGYNSITITPNSSVAKYLYFKIELPNIGNYQAPSGANNVIYRFLVN